MEALQITDIDQQRMVKMVLAILRVCTIVQCRVCKITKGEVNFINLVGEQVTRSAYELMHEQEPQSEGEECGGYCELYNFSILDTQV